MARQPSGMFTMFNASMNANATSVEIHRWPIINPSMLPAYIDTAELNPYIRSTPMSIVTIDEYLRSTSSALMDLQDRFMNLCRSYSQ